MPPAAHGVHGLGAPTADIAVSVTAAPTSVRLGEALVYTVRVANAGPDPATGVTLTDTPPAGAAIPVTPALSQGTLAPGPDGTLVASLGTLAPGAAATMTLAVVLTAFTPGPLPNTGIAVDTARAGADQADPDPSNDAAIGIAGVAPPQPAPPQVVSLRRFGFHAQPTLLTLSFSAPIFPATASDLSNFAVTSPGPDGRFGTADDRVIPIRSARVDGASGDVTLTLGRRLPLSRVYRLRVNASPPSGLTDMFGRPLDGDGDGRPGGDFVAAIVRGLLAGRANQAPGAGPGGTP